MELAAREEWVLGIATAVLLFYLTTTLVPQEQDDTDDDASEDNDSDDYAGSDARLIGAAGLFLFWWGGAGFGNVGLGFRGGRLFLARRCRRGNGRRRRLLLLGRLIVLNSVPGRTAEGYPPSIRSTAYSRTLADGRRPVAWKNIHVSLSGPGPPQMVSQVELSATDFSGGIRSPHQQSRPFARPMTGFLSMTQMS